MKRLLILAAASTALLASACGTIHTASRAEAPAANLSWRQAANAQPFETARSECRAATLGGAHNDAFSTCMAQKGWTRG